jgi:hypothetical protein
MNKKTSFHLASEEINPKERKKKGDENGQLMKQKLNTLFPKG